MPREVPVHLGRSVHQDHLDSLVAQEYQARRDCRGLSAQSDSLDQQELRAVLACLVPSDHLDLPVLLELVVSLEHLDSLEVLEQPVYLVPMEVLDQEVSAYVRSSHSFGANAMMVFYVRGFLVY